jgi:cellulose synthase (UDP-forming)
MTLLAVDIARAPAATHAAPDDDELWSYTHGTGRWFLQFSALSRLCLGAALFFLAMRGDWLKVLLPFGVMMVAGAFISIIWSFQIRAFDRAAHDRLTSQSSWHANSSIDVLITTCGEDPAVIRNTIAHAMRVRHTGTVRVFVLDDKGSSQVQGHAEELGATYIGRENRGWMKKAGNIHHAYGQSDGDFIIILDADFAVREDFLFHTLPYFDDPTIGIVQTPQFFRVDEANWVESGAASQQEQFYRIVQRARDRRGGAICVGTNAVYRRAALEKRGGIALLEHSEDLFTGMKVIDAGYKVSYLPLVLAAGSAPSSTQALASQQYRWARGNYALAGTPLFKRLRLTFMQRLSIWDGWIFYVTSSLSPVIAVLVPILTLVEIPQAISLAPTLMLLPALITEFVLQPRWLYLSNGPASRRVGIISQVAHLFALRDHLSDREQEWVPTGEQVGAHRQATDRIPELIAAAGFWCFLATVGLVGVRAAGGYSLVNLVPVVVLALIALPTALSVTNPAERPAPTEADAEPDGRDGFLDTVRGISIVRVMFWHALGFWWISWVFAAMPAVFYVSGALVAKSVRSRPIGLVIRARLRRLLPPYAVFIAISLVAVFAANPNVWRTHTVDVLSWIIPFQSPAPLPWEEGWLSTPLWFLRSLILVLIATPVAVRLSRFLSAPMWVAVWATALVSLDVAIAHQTSIRATAVLRGVGDLACFGGFFALGVAGHHLRHEFARLYHRGRVLIALVALTAAVTWIAPPGDMIVNNSNVTMALVGLCWLSVVILFEDHFRLIGEIPGVNRLLGWVAANSMTVYLWHTAVLCVAFAIVGAPSSPEDIGVLALIFAPLLVFTVVTLRPFEHRWSSARGQHPLVSVRIIVVLIVGAVMVMQPTLFPKASAAVGPPAPSARPEVGVTETVPVGVDTGGGGIQGWMNGNDVDSAAVVVVGGDAGHSTLSFTGDEPVDATAVTTTVADGQTTVDPSERFEAMSVTKTMVSAAALQLVDAGLITLDGPLPPIAGLPDSLTGSLTLRRLLAHATGLVDYRTVAGFDPEATTDPLDAIIAAYDVSDTSDRTVDYSSTNYFVVGMLIEQITDNSLAEELTNRFFAPLGMDDTELVDNTRSGYVGFASGGVVSTLDDLGTWYDSLFRQKTVLSAPMLDEMIWGGAEFSDASGLGAWRHCPCASATADDPTPWLYLFHDGGDVRVMYYPDEDIVMVARFSKSLYLSPPLAGDIDGFVLQVLGDVSAKPVTG